MKKILVVDQGTTSTRAILFDTQWNLLLSHQIELKPIFPRPAWVEQDPEEIWTSVKICCESVLHQTPTNELIGLGITNQRETTLVWDRHSGITLGNAIVWQDRRTTDICTSLKDFETSIYQKTGLLLDPYFSASKIKWILSQYPGAFERAQRGELLFGTVDSFLLWRLTGGKVHATDITNASRTLLFNITEQSWDDQLLELFSIPRQMLPEVRDNCNNFGNTDKGVFGFSLPILAMMGDQQAAMIGQGCIQSGDAKCTYGTGCFLMINTGSQRQTAQNKLLNTIAYRINAQVNFAIEGSIFAAGTIVKWLRDQLKIIKTAEESETSATSVTSNGDIYFVPAFTGLGAPYWHPEARGAIYGLTRDTQAAHIVRAGLEAVAYQTKDLLNMVEQPIEQLKVDGGMTANNWLMQFIADILRLPIWVNLNSEATATGATYLTALSAGILSDLTDIQKLVKSRNIYYPNMSLDNVHILLQGWKSAVSRTINDVE